MKQDHVHLGFEVGSGDGVSIPLFHTAVTGMTQSSGKTTTLEALAHRSGKAALAFVTKRGEKTFETAHRVQPYFRERADWQFIASLLDATLMEKNKFIRPWIIKVCRNTKTVADVQREVKKSLLTAKGIHEGVYTQIDAYLELIVPEIERADLADSLRLRKGQVNVMDVSSFNLPMQMLFVRSALDWINEKEHDALVVIPEAWQFIPQSKSSPAKAGAVDLVRKGGTLHNFIMVDSQDMAGVDKEILRGCRVWIIGVQREANEIKRALNNIPAGIKRPKPQEIAHLRRGEFFACWDERTAKVYVQPKWMPESAAIAVAKGEATVDLVGKWIRTENYNPPTKVSGFDPDADKITTVTLEEVVNHQNETEWRQPNPHPAGITIGGIIDYELDQERSKEEPMSKETESAIARMEDHLSKLTEMLAHNRTSAPSAPMNGSEEELYQRFKRRLSEEAPHLIKLIASKPEIQVEYERPVVTLTPGRLDGKIGKLIVGGFFNEPRPNEDIHRELKRRGVSYDNRTFGRAMSDLAAMGALTIEEGGYKRNPETKIVGVEK